MGKFCHFAINLHLDLTCSGKEQGERLSRNCCFIENQMCACVVLLCGNLQPSQPFLSFLPPSPRLRAPGCLLLLLWALCPAFNCDSPVMLVLLNVPWPFLELSCPMCWIDCQTGTRSLDMQHSLPPITNHTEASRHTFLLSLNSASHRKLPSSIQISRQLQPSITVGPKLR